MSEFAQREMEKEFDRGKREWSFDEVAELMQKDRGIPIGATKKVLREMAKEQDLMRIGKENSEEKECSEKLD